MDAEWKYLDVLEEKKNYNALYRTRLDVYVEKWWIHKAAKKHYNCEANLVLN